MNAIKYKSANYNQRNAFKSNFLETRNDGVGLPGKHLSPNVFGGRNIARQFSRNIFENQGTWHTQS